MSSIVRTADSKGRITLPGWANAKVIIEAVGVSEFRVRKAKATVKKEKAFSDDEISVRLTEREGQQVLAALKNPPKPNKAAREAAHQFKAKYG